MGKDLQKKRWQRVEKLAFLPTLLAIKCIRGYQLVASPLIGNQCRFIPTCSQYAIESYKKFGFFRGSWLSFRRISKCHPWHNGGIDDVPE